MTATMEQPKTSIERIAAAAAKLADAVTAESYARIKREETEAEIAASIIGTDNPMTGKPHSKTSAVEAAKDYPAAKEARADVIEAERVAILARSEYEIARIVAWGEVGIAR